MTIINQDFEMFTGNTKKLTFIIRDGDGALYDLTGTTLRFEVRLTKTGVVALAKDNGALGGITLTDPTQGEMLVTLNPADTSSFVSGAYYYELQLTAGATVLATLAAGKIETTKKMIA